MIGLGLQTLAAEYSVDLADPDGFELSASELRSALMVVLAVKRDEVRRIADRLADRPGSPCPNILRGELNAASYALKVIDRDLASLLPRKVVVETTAELVREVG